MALAPSYESDSVQAFPIGLNTFQGIATDEHCRSRSVLHSIVDGDVTFTFTDDTTLIINTISGQDFGITRDVKSITSTASVLIG